MKQNRVRGVDDIAAPLLRSHHHRLQAVWDLSLGPDFSSDNQLHALLSDAAVALQADFVELYSVDEQSYVAAGSAEAMSVLDLANYSHDYALGAVTTEITAPLFVADTDTDAIWGAHPLVTAIPLRSVLAVPLEHSGKRHILLLAWKSGRPEELKDEETRYIGFFQRILTRLLQNAAREREIESRIATDALTGLYNRTAMLEQISVAVSAAERAGGSLALLYIDLDGFKELNDSYGHSAGDEALKEAARRMRASLRRHEAAGRMGGDEFAVLVGSFVDEEQLGGIVKRLLASLRSPFTVEGVRITLRASIGVAIYPRDGKAPEELLDNADRAMYQAKRSSGDSFAFFGAPEELAVRHLFAAHLSAPGVESEFFLCYQPIVYARNSKPMAAEALIRWLHPGMGILTPQRFLDESRDNHVLHRIESWVLQSTLQKQLQLRSNGRRLILHVNISEPDPAIFDVTHESLPDLRFEIAESAFAADPKTFARFVTAARDRGLRVGLSGFDGEQLALGVLAGLPLDFVKVAPRVSPPVVETAHRFGWTVIAENVEDARQREFLISLGVDALQGYYVCSPLADSDFDNWLEYQDR